MNANEIRQKFLDFQVKKGHKIIAPAPLVLENDPTTLFTGSGMQPLLPYLLGKPHKDGTRLTDSQPSLRLQDIEDVGDPRHTTVFEMLGNWSLGDYFKEEQIRNFFEFLTKEVGLDPSKIYVTCFIGNEKYGIPKDDEAAAIWQNVFKEAGIDQFDGAGLSEPAQVFCDVYPFSGLRCAGGCDRTGRCGSVYATGSHLSEWSAQGCVGVPDREGLSGTEAAEE